MLGELAEPRPQPFQLPPAHRALLDDAVRALGEDVEFVVLGQQFDVDAFARLLPGLLDQMFFQAVQPSLGRSHEVLHGWIAGAHFGQDRLGGHAAIHHPDAPRFAVLFLDLAQKRPQRLAVCGVARQNLVGQRQAFGRHHQGDHQLRAVRPLVAAVAVAAFVALRQIRGVHFEIRAGQIVEQHLEIGVEQIAPALRQMREQRILMGEQQVMTGVELVRLGQAEIRTQQIGHGAVAETIRDADRHSLPGSISR